MHNLKALGLAFIAMLAFSAVAATAASADDFTSEKYPTTLTGTNEGEVKTDQFLTKAGVVTCARSTYTATITGPTTKVTATANYGDPNPKGGANCTTAGVPNVITTTGCTYIFTIGAATTGDLDIECTGGPVTVTTTPASGTHPCTLTIASQTDIGGTVTYSNIGAGTTREVTVTAKLTGIDYTVVAGTGLAKCSPTGTFTDGSLEALATITGEEDKASNPAHIGIFVS